MIQVFKIIKGIDKIDIKDLGCELNNRQTRGHNLKLVKHRSRLDSSSSVIVHYLNKEYPRTGGGGEAGNALKI